MALRGSKEVKNTMAPTNHDDTIRAKIMSTADRAGYYCPRETSVEGLADHAVGPSDEGRAKELIHELARSDDCPLRYKRTGKTVCIEVDSQRWAAAYIARYDREQLEWDQAQRLG